MFTDLHVRTHATTLNGIALDGAQARERVLVFLLVHVQTTTYTPLGRMIFFLPNYDRSQSLESLTLHFEEEEKLDIR